jgi:hypothetical protein
MTVVLPRTFLASFALAALFVPRAAAAQLLPPLEAPPPPPAPRRPPVPFGRTSGFLWFDVSLENALLHVATPGGQATTEGGLAHIETLASVNVRSFHQWYELEGDIGGSGGGDGLKGVEGDGRLEAYWGVRGYFGDSHGPFVRGGAMARALEHRALQFSYSGAAGEAGYQVIDKTMAFEVGGQAGATNPYGPVFGAFALFVGGPVLLRAEWQHFLPSNGVPFDFLTHRGCVVVHKIAPLCLTQWSIATSSRIDASFFGLSIGVGDGAAGMTREGELPPPPKH